ncbi:MAG TPA: nuclear transport factor 2 family protein [Candidatus Acidoferrales bacterium]|nr:nuclear transport factor 2 family protein [Candidatus Acidoferrales bacterium]
MKASKNRQFLACFAIVTAAAVLLIAAAAFQVSAQAAQDEAVKMQQKFQDAVVAADGAALTSLMADNAVFVHGNGVMQSKAEFIDAITTGKLGVSQYDLHDSKVVLFEGGAIVTGLVDFGLKPPAGSTNPPRILHFRGSAVWVHSSAGWHLVFDQDTTLAGPPAAPAAPAAHP